MNQRILTLFTLGWLAGSALAQDKPADAKPAATNSVLKTDQEKAGYAWGLVSGANFKHNDVDFDLDAAARGLKDGVSGAPPLMTETEAKDVLKKYGEAMQARQAEKLKTLGEKNLKDGAAFLAQNQTKPGVVPLPSGVQYKILAEGSGESPAETDTVVFNYRGLLIDDTEFDNSSKQAVPPKIALNSPNLPKGLAEGLRLMKKGAKWRLFLPPALAGTEHVPPSAPFGPNATLIYEVELLTFGPVEAAPAAAATQPLVSDTIKVPSAEEMKKGAKIETIKQEDLPKEIEKEKARQATNPPAAR